PGQTDGLFVAAGDLTGSGHADIITGTDAGAAPLVKVFNGPDAAPLASFLSDPLAPATGVRVPAADVTGAGHADIITGAGPGGVPRVSVFDGITDKQFYNFFAYAPTFQGGVYVAAGDLGGDGHADIITGPGAGRPEVRLFSGKDLMPLGNFLAFDQTFTGGVRVAAEDVTGSGQLDIVAAQGPGGGQDRFFDGRTLQPLGSLAPYGPAFTNGSFVAGDGRSQSTPPVDPSPTVTVTATTPATSDQPGASPAVFTITRTGDTSSPLTVHFTGGGTAIVGTDWGGFGPGQVVI